MSFPSTVLPVRVKICPGGLPASPETWVWEDITDYVRTASGIAIDYGAPDEATNVDPGKCVLELDNRTGDFSTRNVLGQWYGRLSRNDPLRVELVTGEDSFTRTVGSGLGLAPSGQDWDGSAGWQVDGSAALLTLAAANTTSAQRLEGTKSQDYDFVFTCWTPVAATGASLSFSGLQYVDNSNYLIFRVDFGITAGNMSARIQRVGGSGSSILVTTDPLPTTYSAGEKFRIRCQRDGADVRIKVWEEASAEPDTWTATATETSLPPGLLGFFGWRLSGNTNANAQFFFDDLETVAVPFVGTVAEWPPRWDKSGNNAITPITASGILRRLMQGKSPLQSPIVRRTLRFDPVEYWSLEDASGARSGASALQGGGSATARDVEFGAEAGDLAGASAAVKLSATSVLTGTIRGHTSPAAWGVIFYVKLPAAPAASTRVFSVRVSGSPVRTWALDWGPTTTSIRAYDDAGVLLGETSGAYPTEVTPPAWTAVGLVVDEIGGITQGTFFKHGVGDPSPTFYYLASPLIAGDKGTPRSWLVEGSAGLNEAYLSNVSFYNTDPDFVDFDFADAANGYIGETASDRITRLCAEQGVRVVVEPGDSETLGPQRVDTFLNLLYSAQDADMGILYERGSSLAYRPRGARYNRAVELALDFDAGHIAEPPEPTDDDQRLRNRVTVSRDNGSSATVSDEASIASAGLYDDSKTINVETDAVLPYHAAAYVGLGTVDEYRWPKIDLNLARNPQLIDDWLACEPFPRMTVANVPAQVTGAEVDVTVEGYSMVLKPYSWDITLNCSPAKPWQAGIVEDTDLGRADAEPDQVLLQAEANPAATTLLADIAYGELIVTDPSQVSAGDPIFVTAGTGEELSITGVSGATSPQTLTVVRGLNGINLPIPAGTPIVLTYPMQAVL